MQKRNSNLSFLLTISALLLAVTFVPSIKAQTPAPAPQYYQVQVVKLQPGMSAEWAKMYQAEVLPALKKAGVKQLSVLSVGQGDVRIRIIIRPLESLTQLDEPGPLAKVLGQEAANALNQKLSHFYAEVHFYVTQGRPDLGIAPTSSEPINLATLIKTTITPGRTAEWEKYIKESNLPAAKKAGIKGVLVGKIVAGGDTNEYRTLLLTDSWAEGVKFFQASAKAKAEMNLPTSAPAGVVTHSEMLVVRFVPELSIRPEPQKAAK